MVSEEGLKMMAKAIMAQGYDLETATRFAVLIGDTPELDERGFFVVRDDDDKVLALLSPSTFKPAPSPQPSNQTKNPGRLRGSPGTV